MICDKLAARSENAAASEISDIKLLRLGVVLFHAFRLTTMKTPAKFCPLASVRQRIKLGEPLQFNVRDGDGMLLLASGQLLTTPEQIEALFERGALVDV